MIQNLGTARVYASGIQAHFRITEKAILPPSVAHSMSLQKILSLQEKSSALSMISALQCAARWENRKIADHRK
jgi:hypothetical protein